MSFMYPRTISIRRPNPQTGVGAIGYGGETAANEGVIATGLPANVQQNRQHGSTYAGLPGSEPERTGWHVFIPARAAALGVISERDIVVDDVGKRYEVIGAYWNSLGYRLYAELLQA